MTHLKSVLKTPLLSLYVAGNSIQVKIDSIPPLSSSSLSSSTPKRKRRKRGEEEEEEEEEGEKKKDLSLGMKNVVCSLTEEKGKREGEGEEREGGRFDLVSDVKEGILLDCTIDIIRVSLFFFFFLFSFFFFFFLFLSFPILFKISQKPKTNSLTNNNKKKK